MKKNTTRADCGDERPSRSAGRSNIAEMALGARHAAGYQAGYQHRLDHQQTNGISMVPAARAAA